MLTSTDIPPGGEGKIEVTFDSSHKKGLQKKSVTVESNDPSNPRKSLQISALIEVVFGFEQSVQDFGRSRRGEPVSITTTLLVKDPSIRNTVTFVSSSPHITATLAKAPAGSASENGKLTVEVKGSSDMPVGKINATLTARAGVSSVADAGIQIQGTVVGNVEVTPDRVQFHVDTSKADAKPVKQVIKVVSTEDGAQIHILDIKDVDQRLKFHVDTLLADKQYEISLTPLQAVMRARQNVSGAITITTDDKEQPATFVSYYVSFGR